MGAILYSRTGAAFTLDHEVNGTAYVRPMVKMIFQSSNYQGDDFEQVEDFEPADYLVAMDRAALFGTPPVEQVNDDIAAKQAELKAIQAEAAKAVRQAKSDKATAARELESAQRQLSDWMDKHRAMIDLGKLLDGKVLYPLSVNRNHYHRAPDIPHIPEMRKAKYLAVTGGDFEKGQKWTAFESASDDYGRSVRFFDTEAERAAVIASEFMAACDGFRKFPNFDTTRHTSGTTLHYGTLMEWVKTHPALSIPDDIKAMKAADDAEAVEAKRAKLAAELAALEATP